MNFKKIAGITILLLLGLTVVNTCTQSNLFEKVLSFQETHSQKSCQGDTNDFSTLESIGASFLAISQQNTNQELLANLPKDHSSFLLFLALISLIVLLASAINSKTRIRKLKRSPPRLYNRWQNLFQSGILHPQIFS